MLAELLDQVLPADAIDAAASGARQFEARYGLLGKPALIRFRILDPARTIGGMSDLSVPVAQFAALKLGRGTSLHHRKRNQRAGISRMCAPAW